MADWLRSTSVRLSLAFAAMIIFAFVAAGALIWRSIGDVTERQIRQQILLETAAIEGELAAEGIDAAVAAIDIRAERPGAFEYWLTNPRGRRLAGDLDALDGPVGWRRIHLDRTEAGAEGAQILLVLTRSLDGGFRLSVGEDLSRSADLRSAILRSIGGVGAITLLVCLFAGAVITRRALQKIDRLNITLERVGRGELTARYATVKASTDIDDIGAGIDLMLDRIEALVRNVRRVSRDVAHDLRTPLTHLRQRIESLAGAETTAARAAAMDDALAKVDDIIRMFDATLRLAEIDGGEARKRFHPVDLADVVANVVDAYRPDIEDSGRRLVIERLDSVSVAGDEALLAQALANLIENAMRHSPPGTEIRVSAAGDPSAAALVVSDDGPGIPESERERVLEPFSRLDASRTTQGSGLGLSIVAAIARAHGARLELSDAGPGLRITLEWPH
ncbi:MAG: ATP-binding protein [Pseudomonadales bacterium]